MNNTLDSHPIFSTGVINIYKRNKVFYKDSDTPILGYNEILIDKELDKLEPGYCYVVDPSSLSGILKTSTNAIKKKSHVGLTIYSIQDNQLEQAICTTVDLPEGWSDEEPKSIFYKLNKKNKWIPDNSESNVAELRLIKLKELQSKSNEIFEELSSSQYIPDFEIAIWPNLESEARSLKSDPKSDTPYLDIISEERDLDKSKLADKIIEKADKLNLAKVKLIATRQRIKSEIDNLNTINELEGYNIDISAER